MKRAFTLAETLITRAIIGVVAVMVIPTLLDNNQKKALTTARKVNEIKFQEVMNQMRANEKLSGYNTADEFVNEFVKYIKTGDRCDSNSLTKCFNDTIKTSDDEDVKTNTLKTGSDIALTEPQNYPSANVGITIQNGTMAILNYDKPVSGNIHIQAAV